MKFSIIVAIDEERGIGKDNTIPWRLSGDMQYFARTTTETTDFRKQNAVIMGTNTWRSLPEKYRPLPRRLNVVLNREKDLSVPRGVLLFDSFDTVLEELDGRDDIEQTFVIGGAMLYASAINHISSDMLYITLVSGTYDCDTFFPEIPDMFRQFWESEIQEEGGVTYQFLRYDRQ